MNTEPENSINFLDANLFIREKMSAETPYRVPSTDNIDARPTFWPLTLTGLLIKKKIKMHTFFNQEALTA